MVSQGVIGALNKSIASLILTVMLTDLIGMFWSQLDTRLNAQQSKIEALSEFTHGIDKKYIGINEKLDLILQLLQK